MADDAIREAWEAGRIAWPDVELDLARFAGFAANASQGGIRFPEDLYLAAACGAGNTAALAAFEREMLAPAHGAIRAIDANDDFVSEAFQRLRTSLFAGPARPKIESYAGRGPLRAWVGIAAVRTALMMRRQQQRTREVPDDGWTDALATISTHNPELELLKRHYAVEFARALREAIDELEPRLRAALRMSFVDAASIDTIAAAYAVHRATAARWIERACDEVFARTRHHLTRRLALSATEVDRMTALIRSQLDVSISQLLLDPPGA